MTTHAPARRSTLPPAAVLAALAATVPAGFVSAATLAVPGDFPTIAGAVVAAVDGDVIEISPGTWGAFSVVGKELTIRGTGADPGDVVISAGGSSDHSVEVLGSTDFTIENLTLRGSLGSKLRITNSTADVRDLEIQGAPVANEDRSVAILISGSEALLERCLVIDNGPAGLFGSSSTIGVIGQSDVTLREISVIANTTENEAPIVVISSDVNINRSLITLNSKTAPLEDSGASAVGLTDTFPSPGGVVRVGNSIIAANAGAAPFVALGQTRLEVINCTVVDNASAMNGLVLNSPLPEIVVTNTIARDDTLPAINVTQLAEVSYCNISGGTEWGPLNFGLPPEFESLVTYTLSPDSPCIDAGIDEAAVGGLDFDGGARIIDEYLVSNDQFPGETTIDIGAQERASRVGFVRDDASGGGDGATWATAFDDLQDALDAADAGDLEQIWIAGGSYRPDRGTGDRDDSFRLVSGVAVIGGFRGDVEDPSDLDRANETTVLSGVIGGEGIADNTKHVVEAFSLSDDTLLEGVTIRRGNAEGSPDGGSGLRVVGGAPHFSQVIVSRCVAPNDLPTAVVVEDSDATFDGLTIWGNGFEGTGGPALDVAGGAPILVNVLVHGNDSAGGAPAVSYREGADGRMVNATIAGNTSTGATAGFEAFDESPAALDNSIVWGNVAENPEPGAPAARTQVRGSNLTVRGTTVEFYDGPLPSVNALRPSFVDPDGVDDVPGNGDDDYRLASGSCLIDSGNSQLVPNGTPGDLDLNPRKQDDPGRVDSGVGFPNAVDRGAYEFGGASCPSDIDLNGTVDFTDLLAVLSAWGDAAGEPGDIDCTVGVDFNDLLTLLAAWGPCS